MPKRNNRSDWGVLEMARDKPFAATAAAVGAAAAGVFLWSKRAQISDQLSSLSDQVGQWSNGLRSSDGSDFETSAAPTVNRSGTGSASATNRRSSARRPTPTSSPG